MTPKKQYATPSEFATTLCGKLTAKGISIASFAKKAAVTTFTLNEILKGQNKHAGPAIRRVVTAANKTFGSNVALKFTKTNRRTSRTATTSTPATRDSSPFQIATNVNITGDEIETIVINLPLEKRVSLMKRIVSSL